MALPSSALGRLTTQRALEVPLSSADGPSDALPTRDVPALGEAAFELPTLPSGAALAGRSEASPGSSSACCLLWRLEGAVPQTLVLQEAGVTDERREAAAALAFEAPLLPAIAAADVHGGQGTRVSALTADGALHTFVHSGTPGAASLARQLATADALTSVPLAPLLARAGSPTALLEVGGHLCIGTAEGNLVCLLTGPGPDDVAAAFQLSPTSGLSKMLGGLFGQQRGQAVCQLAELRHLDRRLLVSIHESGMLRLWDLPSRRLVHAADLLTTPEQGRLVPKLARLTAEPLDASTSILVVYFEPTEEAGEETGRLTLFELIVEHRGEGAYKVLVEMGSQLHMGAAMHRVQDIALESMALHTVGAWLLYDTAAGRRSLVCVPLSFKPGEVSAATEVLLIEDQLEEGCQSSEAAAQEEEACKAAEAQLAQLGSGAPAPAALAAALADVVLAPGQLSRSALAAALAALGCAVQREEVLAADLQELRQQLPRWVAGAAATAGASAAATAAGSGGGSSALLAKWTALLQAYAAAWQQQHLPLALLQLAPQGDDSCTLMVARRCGLVTALRLAAAPELALKDALPEEWHKVASEAAESATLVLEAASAVAQAAGGSQLARLLWAGMREGTDVGAVLLPALVRALAGGAPAAAAAAGAGSGRLGFPGGAAAPASAHSQWRAACRKLPLRVARLCSSAADSSTGGFAAAVAAALNILGSDYEDASRLRSSLPAVTKPIRAVVLASLAQVAWAQLQVLSQLALLLQYLLWSQTLAHWSLPPEDSHQIEAVLLPRALDLLQAAAVAYWSAVTPVQDSSAAGTDGSAAALDAAQLVVALRIGEGPAGAQAAAKRARLAHGPQDAYVSSLLLSQLASTRHVHVVRDLPDLQRVALLFSQRLLCLSPSPLHASAGRRPSSAGRGGGSSEPLTPADLGVDVCAALFRGRHTAQLAALQRLLPSGSQDMRLLFFRACAAARQIALAPSQEEQQRLEQQACALFFRVAAVFSPGPSQAAFPGQAAAVAHCAQQLLAELSGPGGEGARADSLEAAELQYYEALMTLFERLGRHSAAARCALAAARQVGAVLPAPEQQLERTAAQGRLWANVFGCMMEAGRYEEAYVAVLSIEAADVQVDCLHRLIAGLCAAEGGVELLCRLPWAHNLLLVKGGQQTWVPMLEEVIATLQRRAAQLDLRASPQPFKVLADFHIARSDFQAAAGAQLAFARRLVGECPEEPAMLAEAEHALAAAVSCLSLVERSAAWVEDPAAEEALIASSSSAGGGGGGKSSSGGKTSSQPSPVLTLAALQREYAVVRGHRALAAAMPGGQQGHASLARGQSGVADALRGGDAENVFAQLLALCLHDEAFQLAEAAFVGTQLTRALERVFASLAAACVHAQMAWGRPAGAADGAAAAAGADEMVTDEGAAGSSAAAAAAGDGREGGGAAAVADWRRLKDWLQRHEGGQPRCGLRLVILEALLRTEPSFMLPPWLMRAFRPPAAAAPGAAAAATPSSSADLAGALRVLMRHNRLADAAELAAAHLQATLHSVPSVGMARTSQVYLPAALLDQLVAQLGANGAPLAAERQQVADLLQRHGCRTGAYRAGSCARWALPLALLLALLGLASGAAAIDTRARTGSEWLQQLSDALQNGAMPCSGEATVALAADVAVTQATVNALGLTLPLNVPPGCTLRLVGAGGDKLSTIDFGTLDNTIMKQPLLFLQNGSDLSLPGFLAVGAAPGATMELLNCSVAMFPGEWCTPQLAKAAAFALQKSAASGTTIAEGSTIRMDGVVMDVPITSSKPGGNNTSGGSVTFITDGTNFTCLGIAEQLFPAAPDLAGASVQPVTSGAAFMAALAALAAKQEAGAGIISLQQDVVLSASDTAGFQLPMNISANRTLAIEGAGGAMHSLDFGGTPLLLYMQPGSGLVLRNVNVSGTAHIGMFGVFASDSSEGQYPAVVKALPTQVDSSPLFPTINNGPNTRVEMTNMSILLKPSKLCTPELVQEQVQGFAQLLGGTSRFRTNGTTATVVQLALPVPITQTSTGTPIGMGQVEMNNVSMMCTLASPDADWQEAPRQQVANASQLLAALAGQAAVNSPGVAVLEISSDFVLDASAQDTTLPVTIASGRTLVLSGGESGATIDVSGAEKLLVLEPDAALVLVNISMTGFGPIHSDGPEGRQWTNNTRTVTDPFPMYPTINASPNSTLAMLNSSLTLRPSDQCTKEVLSGQISLFSLLTGDPSFVTLDDLTVVVNSFSAPYVPVYNQSSSTPTGTMTVRASGLNVTCLPLSTSSAGVPSSSSGGSTSSGGSGGGVPAYVWAIVGVVAAAVVAGAITAALLIRRRRLRRAGSVVGMPKDPERADDPPAASPQDSAAVQEDDSPCNSPDASTELQDGLWRSRVGFVDGLVLGGVLGGGGYGRVYRGTWRGAKVAVKVVATHVSVGDIYDLTREPLLSMSLSHPNLLPTFKTCVVRLLPEPVSTQPSTELTVSSNAGSELGSGGSTTLAPRTNTATRVVRSILDRNALVEIMPLTSVLQPGEYETWLVSEYADRGSLADAIKRGQLKATDPAAGARGCDMPAVLLCLLDVARGLEYLHSCSIVHGDLKKENVLLKSERRDRRGYVCKLGDFGLSRLLAEHQTHVDTGSYGTASIAAPELLCEGRLTKSSDIYAFGILLWEMVSCQNAFSDTSTLQILWLVAHQKWRPPMPEGCPPALADLMQRCWQEDPRARPEASKVATDLLAFADTLVKQRAASPPLSGRTQLAQRSSSLPQPASRASMHTQTAALRGAALQKQRPARQQRAARMQTSALFGRKGSTAVVEKEAAPAKPARGGLFGSRGSSKQQTAAPAKQQKKSKVDKAAEYEKRQGLFGRAVSALDFAEVRSKNDAELLYEAKYGKRGEDGKMSREQYAALRRRVGGTAKDYWKDWVETKGEYVDKGYVAKDKSATAASVPALPFLVGTVVALFGATAWVVASTS
ncbi:kinase [Chlorella sorokiniana]|uniref:Kinase n=1 Tax=Chlorella sorokiniana TaxID=3076 RepID=A0A2P6TEC0_CHLSO|nr:kinase [Chlorella sorokiniana]|eukprot:PRW20989.1 kinase [Chlorella sorokiniana]